MNISRKDFFRKSLFSLGEAFCSLGETLKTQDADKLVLHDAEDFVPVERDDQLAVAFNEHCLAKNCGCFACEERCPPRAILVVMGEGIRIDAALCSGCGACEYVCPVTPKAVRMEPRKKEMDQAVHDAETITKKGE